MTPSAGPGFSLFRPYMFAGHPTELCRNCICRSSFNGLRTARDAEFLFSSAGLAVCLHAHLSPYVNPPGNLNFVQFGSMPIIT